MMREFRVFRRLLLITLAMCGLGGICAAQALATCTSSCTWSGGGAFGSSNWSNASNWSSGQPVSGTNGTISFPNLPAACNPSGGPPPNACYSSHNDLTGVSATQLMIDDGSPYNITGNAITLTGSTGIAADTAVTTFLGVPQISTPITLGADQTWTISGGSTGNQTGQLYMSGNVSGAHALTINLTNGGLFGLTADAEVNSVNVTGDGTGAVALGNPGTPGSLNGVSGNQVTVSNGTLFTTGSDHTGALTMGSTTTLTLGNPGPNGASILNVNGSASLSGGGFALSINSSGATAGTNFSQLQASGPFQAGGSRLVLREGSGCPASGTYTLVSASAVNGTFGNAPTSGNLIRVFGGSGCNHVAQINYTSNSVTATIETGTSTSVGASTNSPSVGQNVTYTATVTPPSGGPMPTGSVEFDDNGVAISTCSFQPLTPGTSSSTATCTTSYSATGSHQITAVYSGDQTYPSSTSPAITVNVGTGSSTTTTTTSSTGTSTTSTTTSSTTTTSTTATSTTSTTTHTTTTGTGRHRHKKKHKCKHGRVRKHGKCVAKHKKHNKHK